MELDFVAVSAVVGIVLPLAISLLKNVGATWNTQLVRAFAFALAAAAAVIQTGAELGWSNLDVNIILGSFTIIYTLAQSTFKGLWEGTKIETALASTMNVE